MVWYLFFLYLRVSCFIGLFNDTVTISVAALWPHAYTLQLAEARASGIAANSFSVRPSEIETVNIPEGQGHGGIGLRDTSPILDNMEAGRRYQN
jgi:hypothetical protein